MSCPCGNVQQPVSLFVPETVNVVEGNYGQTIEMLWVLRDKIICLNQHSSSETRDLYFSYVQEMLGENAPYKYNISDFYYSIIYEECN